MSRELVKEFKNLVDLTLKDRESRVPPDAETIEKHKYKTRTVNGVCIGESEELDGIKKVLASKGKFGSNELHQIKRELLSDYFINGIEHSPYFSIADKFFDHTRKESGSLADFDDVKAWKVAIALALDFIEYNPQLSTNSTDELIRTHRRLYSVCQQANYLKSKGFRIEIKEGRVNLNEDDYKTVSNRIDELTKEIGGLVVLGCLVQAAEKSWDSKLYRFHFVRSTSPTNSTGSPGVPWGYLINLCAKYPYDKAIDKDNSENLKELFNLATAITAIFDVQPYTTFDGMFNTPESILYYLREIIIYDTLFAIRQVRPVDAINLCRGMFSWVDSDKLLKSTGWKIKDAIKVFELISKMVEPFKFTSFNSQYIFKMITDIPPKRIEAVLDSFSHKGSANKDYLDPNEYTTIDLQMKPLIKLDANKYLLLLPSICFVGLFEAFATCIRETKIEPQTDKKIGDSLEPTLKGILTRRRISFHSGIYQLKKGFPHESDLIIETKDKIIFVEIKKKPLTRIARTGDPVGILADISGSLIASQVQLGEHELVLREKGELELTDGTKTSKVELRGREIEKISIALDDYGAVQDRRVIHQILNLFVTTRFGAVDPKDKEKLDKLSTKCHEIYEQIEKIIKMGVASNPNPFFNCWFLSVYQFLVLLDDVNSNEEFYEELKRTRHITFSTLDFYYEYSQMKKISAGKKGLGA